MTTVSSPSTITVRAVPASERGAGLDWVARSRAAASTVLLGVAELAILCPA